MKAQEFVDEVKRNIGVDFDDKFNTKMLLFDMLVCDMGSILATRAGVEKNRLASVSSFMETTSDYGYSVDKCEKCLGSILREINHKAEKINKLGKYGFPEDWFRYLFIEKVKNYIVNHSTSRWRDYFPERKETAGVTYPAFNVIKEFLNP
jgi:hypothetical protein